MQGGWRNQYKIAFGFNGLTLAPVWLLAFRGCTGQTLDLMPVVDLAQEPPPLCVFRILCILNAPRI